MNNLDQCREALGCVDDARLMMERADTLTGAMEGNTRRLCRQVCSDLRGLKGAVLLELRAIEQRKIEEAL